MHGIITQKNDTLRLGSHGKKAFLLLAESPKKDNSDRLRVSEAGWPRSHTSSNRFWPVSCRSLSCLSSSDLLQELGGEAGRSPLAHACGSGGGLPDNPRVSCSRSAERILP